MQHARDRTDSTILTDGAWGTELQSRGLRPGECPDLLNLTHPDQVFAVARSYVDAGSDVILTNTFGANAIALRRFDAADRAAEINRRGVELSIRAAEEGARVFASMGPSGGMLMMGDVSESELDDAFASQAGHLAGAGADAIVIETMSDLDEALIALRAAKPAGLPVIVSMVFDSGPDRDRTMMGISPTDAARILTEAGADGIGANCGIGIETAARICALLRLGTVLPVWIKPNAGLPELVTSIHGAESDGSAGDGQRLVYPVDADRFASFLPGVIEAGATYVGGCCGTTPAYVRAMRLALGAM